jgi:hypothetical protein
VDTGEMREVFQSYLRELRWAPGVTKDGLVAHLASRDEALRTMVNLYVDGPAGQDDRGSYQAGGPLPPTPGFGQSAGATGEEGPTGVATGPSNPSQTRGS